MKKAFWVWAAVLSCIFGHLTRAMAEGALGERAPVACQLDQAKGHPGLDRTHPFARGEVVLTFDDGPQPIATKKLLELLDQHGFKATIHDRMRHDALKAAFAVMARDPKINVTTLRRVVEAKYACPVEQLHASLQPSRSGAARLTSSRAPASD